MSQYPSSTIDALRLAQDQGALAPLQPLQPLQPGIADAGLGALGPADLGGEGISVAAPPAVGIVINVASLNGENGFKIVGHHSYDQIGAQVAGAGDLNHDGYADFLISDVNGNDTGFNETYVVYGHAGPYAASLDTGALDGSNGYTIRLPEGIDGPPLNSLSTGDFNGDGQLDIAIGASRTVVNDNNFVGASYLLFGHDGATDATVSAVALDGTDGFRVDGPGAQASFGESLTLAGDINGDGLDDLIVAAQGTSPHGLYSGAVYVIFGTTSPFPADFSLSDLNGANGFDIDGLKAGDLVGRVADAGDVNGDGYDDLIIGAQGVDGGKTRPAAGAAYVIYGHPGGFPAHFDLSTLDGTNGYRLDGDNHTQSDVAGRSVSSAGDVNGDGFADLLVGANPYDHSRDGAAYVVFGAAASPGASENLASLDGGDGFKIAGATNTYTAYDVSSAGDVNGDGFSDIIVSATGTTARAFVVYGHAGPFDATLDLNNLTSAQGFEIVGPSQSTPWPHSVSSAGDINGDGLDDVLVGARGDPAGHSPFNGATYVIFGQQPGEAVDRVGTAASQHLVGGAFDDMLSGMGGDDQLFGNGGADTLSGGAGDDTINGGDGEDTVVFSGDRADYQVTALGGGSGQFTDQRDGAPDGSDLVNGVETFVFADVTLAASDLFVQLEVDGGEADHKLVEAGLAGAGVATATASPITASGAVGALSYDLSGWTEVDADTYTRAGTYGSATLDTATGVVSYVLDNADPDTQALALRQAAADQFTLTVRDQAGGSGEATVVFDIVGANDAPEITGGGAVFTHLVEAGLDGAGLATVSSSPITFTDPDAADAPRFNVAGWHQVGATHSYTHAGVYGTATLDIDTGVVSYLLNNADPDTQALAKGQTATDSFLVSITDGHGGGDSTTVVFTIDGAYDSPTGTRGADILTGDGHDDLIDGGKGADQISGGGGADTLLGSAGDDTLSGGAGNDVLAGGAGTDVLTGGAGGDVFQFASVSDSWKKTVDLITDLDRADGIDLSAIDADSGTAGDQAFHLVTSFSHHAGELTISFDATKNLTMVRGDIDGDGKADLVISIAGDHHDFTNFVL